MHPGRAHGWLPAVMDIWFHGRFQESQGPLRGFAALLEAVPWVNDPPPAEFSGTLLLHALPGQMVFLRTGSNRAAAKIEFHAQSLRGCPLLLASAEIRSGTSSWFMKHTGSETGVPVRFSPQDAYVFGGISS